MKVTITRQQAIDLGQQLKKNLGIDNETMEFNITYACKIPPIPTKSLDCVQMMLVSMSMFRIPVTEQGDTLEMTIDNLEQATRSFAKMLKLLWNMRDLNNKILNGEPYDATEIQEQVD